MSPLRLLAIAVMAATFGVSLDARNERVAEAADVFVDFDHVSGAWTLGTSQVRYTLQVGRSGELTFAGFARVDGDSPVTSSGSDARVSLGGATTLLGTRDSSFSVDRVSTDHVNGGLQLQFRLRHRELPIAAVRTYQAFSGGAIVETWTTFEATGNASVTVRDLNAVALDVPNTAVEWSTGLDVPEEQGGSFTRRSTVVSDGQRFEIGAATISTETALPIVSFPLADQRLVMALAWSGAWSASFDREGGELHVAMGLPPMAAVARPGAAIEGPHAVLGLVANQPGRVQDAVTSYLLASRGGRPYPSPTAFNTWFVRGTAIDADLMRRDIELASRIGLEVFQLDAGWYPTGRANSIFDFTSGLGSWQVDRARFPEGLGPIGDYARERGMRFGVWVEPERVALDTVGRDRGADARFLATEGGRYDPGVSNDEARDAQVCLGHGAAREWVLARLTSFIDETRPDYLKWDFNRWVTCTRADHDHAAEGGNFAHVRGLYELLDDVRRRYPNLMLENCSGGGHRLDLALAARTDVGWMDDRSAPSAHVRHNLRGLLAFLPGSYLFSYVMPGRDEPMTMESDLPLMTRSRLPGVFGIAADLGALEEGVFFRLNQSVELARQLRPLQAGAVAHQLVYDESWDVLEQVSAAGAVVFAFESRADRAVRAVLRGLDPATVYEVRSLDFGLQGTASGADLMSAGFEILPSPVSSAQVYTFVPAGGR